MSSELTSGSKFISRDYHEYMDVWQPKNESLVVKTDKNAVAVINECGSGTSTVEFRAHLNEVRMNMEVVGHIPKLMACSVGHKVS